MVVSIFFDELCQADFVLLPFLSFPPPPISPVAFPDVTSREVDHHLEVQASNCRANEIKISQCARQFSLM